MSVSADWLNCSTPEEALQAYQALPPELQAEWDEHLLALTPRLAPTLSFREFIRLVKPKYRFFRHCEQLIDVLQRVADGELKRVMVFMPPRHGKSELVSRLFTAYFLYRYPERWVAVTSYGADLAYTLSRAARDNFQAAGGKLRGDAEAVKHWETEAGGGLWACGVGGPATGKGWHLGVVDDPLKNAEEAASETIREKHKEWYDSTFYTREEPDEHDNPDGALVVVQTRWNEDDLSGWLLKQERDSAEDGDADPEGWHIVNFAALKENPESEPEWPATCTVETDWREPGEALCPERRPVEKLLRLKRRMLPYFWSALFQQRPTPDEGAVFKSAWFKRYRIEGGCYVLLRGDRESRVLAEDCWTVTTVDFAGSERETADWTVVSTWAVTPHRDVLLLDVRREHHEGPEAKNPVREAFWKYRPQKIIIERNGLGGPLVRQLQAEGLPIQGVWQHRDKKIRALGAAARYEAGTVFHPLSARWLGDWEQELLSFGAGASKDDQVDTASLMAQFISRGVEVLSEFNPSTHVARDLGFDPARPLVCGWSFLGAWPAWVVGQLTPAGEFHVVGALAGRRDEGVWEFGQKVLRFLGPEATTLDLRHYAHPGHCGVKGENRPHPDAFLTLLSGVPAVTGYLPQGTPLGEGKPGLGITLTPCMETRREKREEGLRSRLTTLLSGLPALQVDAESAAPLVEALSGYRYKQNALGLPSGDIETNESPAAALVEALSVALYGLQGAAPARDEDEDWGGGYGGTASGAGRRRKG